MSTAGSAHKPSSLTPGDGLSSAGPESRVPRPESRHRLFRWQGIFGLMAIAVILVGGWVLFADFIIKSTVTEAATKALGVEVDIDKLDLSFRTLSLDIRGFTVAHPTDPMRNVID